MSKPEYDALVNKIVKLMMQSEGTYGEDAHAILALIREQLRVPSKAMIEAADKASIEWGMDRGEYDGVIEDFHAIIDASPLTPD